MTTWFNLAAIGAAGAIGAVSRYGITQGAAALPGGSTMLGTTIVNVLGCALLGAVTALGDFESPAVARLVLAIRVGFLGSLTTFSTFSGESALLATQGRWGASSTYVLANLMLGWITILAAETLVKGWTQT